MVKKFSVAVLGVICASTGISAQSSLDRIPQYTPSQQVTGVIRNYGSALGGMVKMWEDDFVKHQPGISFKDNFAGSDAAISGLDTMEYDLAPNGRETTLIEYLSFYEVYNSNPFEVTVGTGAFDIPGRTWALAIFVNKDNPITKLTMNQLDGIFGEARTGGANGFVWEGGDRARTAKENIRTWGQLGLKGQWKNKEIQTYGYAPTGMSLFFQQKVLHGNDKWNPNYREYAESGTKMVPKDSTLGSHDMLVDLAHDKYGIAWGGIGQAKGIEGIKPIALAMNDNGPYVEPTLESISNRTYPLTRSIFIYLKHVPGSPLDPKLREFLLYVLSREGQEVIQAHGQYIPLTPEVAAQQREQLLK